MSNCELKPARVFEQFAEINKIPRPSKHEEHMIEYLKSFAEKRGLEYEVDETGNVIIRKPATKGHEAAPMVSLQSHMDMVCDKLVDIEFDFHKDAIQTYVDGEWLTAKGTTLGADDGIGCAIELAILDSDDIEHGPLECVFTRDEETSLTGAMGMKEGFMKGDMLINLDSEDEGQIFISCAGGKTTSAKFTFTREQAPEGYFFLKASIKGLKGGHSGLEIHEGRGNANKLMARFVREAIAEYGARLATWHGGNMRNAIPFECEVVLTLPKEKVEALKEDVEEWCKLFNHEYRTIEENIQFFAEDVATPENETPEEIQDNLLDAIYGCHNGVLRMIPVFPTVVETSSNLAIIDIEGGHAYFKLLARSANESMRDYIAKTLESTFSMAGMKVEFSGAYGGWDPNTDSEILHLLEKNYLELFGEEAIEQVDHAGLECSVILEKYPHLDVVSLGPTLRSPHTTIERCNISTVAPFWELLKKTMETVPVK